MPNAKLQRMLFRQGEHCFFCDLTIPKGEESLEHLVPSSGGGTEHPDNLVACCQTLNALFGNMSVKEKIRTILKQDGKFVCPDQSAQPQMNQATSQHRKSKTPTKPAQSNGIAANLPANHGKPWTAAEDKKLADAFDSQTNIATLAKAHKRGVGGIESRLIKLGKLAPTQDETNPRKSPSPNEPAFDLDTILKRLVKLKPTKRVKATNSIKAMFQFDAPITDDTASKILDDLRKRGSLSIDGNDKIQFRNA